jgi:hypothetical protein
LAERVKKANHTAGFLLILHPLTVMTFEAEIYTRKFDFYHAGLIVVKL